MPFYHKLEIFHQNVIHNSVNQTAICIMNNLFGTVGFDGMSTNSYHEQRPTQVKEIRKQYSVAPKIAKATIFNPIN
jgi:homogentisate 1,2-dioxygenase